MPALLRIASLVLVALLIAVCGRPAAAQDVMATPQKPLTIAITEDYSPFTVMTPDGQPAGLLVEMWRLWSETTGIPIEFRATDWPNTLNDVKLGTADIHSGLFRNDQRAEWMAFSEPVHETKTAVYVRAGSGTLPSLDQLSGKKVGTVEGTHQIQYLREKHKNIVVVGHNSSEDMISALFRGEIDAIFDEMPTIDIAASKSGLRGILIRDSEPILTNTVHAGVLKENTELLEKINEGFHNIDLKRLAEIERRWLPDPDEHFYAGAEGKITLTEREEALLNSRPVIRLAVTDFIQPVDIVDKEGNYTGLNADLIALLNSKLGTNIVPEFHSKWGDVVAKTMAGVVDGAFSLSRTPEREKSVLFTKPYAFDPIIAVVRQETASVNTWDDLKGKVVSVVKGASIIAEIRDRLGDGVLAEVESEIDGLRGLSAGTADVHVSWLIPYGNVQKQQHFPGLRIALTRNSEGGTLRIGIHKSLPQLYSIIRKGLNAISRDELAQVRDRWLGVGQDDDRKSVDLKLTAVEKSWIREHPVITLAATPDWPPFEQRLKDESYTGITSDFVRLATERAGLKIKLVFDTWPRNLEQLKLGELDLAPGLFRTPEREKFLDFTRPFIEMYDVIYTGADRNDIQSMDDLADKKVAVEEGYYMQEYLRSNYPQMKIIAAVNTLDALKALSLGKVDGYVGTQIVAASIIKEHLLQNIKSVGFAKQEPNFLAMGTPKDRPLLHSIMDKAIASISLKERSQIIETYVGTGQRLSAYDLDLTLEERSWLTAHRTIRVHNETDWPPFNFNEAERPKGYSIDYMNLLAEKLGITIDYISGPTWGAFLEMIRKKDLDVMLNIIKTDDRSQYINFTTPYLENPPAIITRNETTDINSLSDLKGKTVSIPKGFFYQELLEKNFPDIKLKLTENQVDSLKDVASGEADATLGGIAIQSYLIRKYLLSNLKVGNLITDQRFSNQLRIGVRQDWPIFRNILQKAMAAITEEEQAGLQARWLFKAGDATLVELTDEEKLWLNQHREIRLGDDYSWPPFSFVSSDGKYSGISAGYAKAVSKRLGITMTPKLGLTWTQVLDKVKTGEVDILPAITRNEQREKYLNFTKPYISFPVVITTRQDSPFVDSLGDLTGKKVGVVKGYFTEDLLKSEYPDLKLVTPPTLQAGLKDLNEGKMDAFVDNLGAITFEIDRAGLHNLKIAAPTEYKFDLSFGVRKDWPELVVILDKALDTLTDQEKIAIKNAWMAIQVSFGLDITTVLIWVIPIGLGAALIIAFVVYWNRQISKQKEAVELSEERTRLLLESVGEGVFGVDLEGRVTFVNPKVEEILGFQPEDLMGNKVHAIIHHSHPDGSDYPVENCPMWRTYTTGVPANIEDEVLWRKDGTAVPVEYNSTPIVRKNKVVGAVISFQDITERKRAERKLQFTQYAVDNAAETIFWVRPDDGGLDYVNEAACRNLGYTREEMLAMHIPQIDIDFPAEKFPELLMALTDKRFTSFESRHQKKNGDIIDVEVRAYLAENDDREIFVANAVDITESKRARAALQEAHEVITDSIQYASHIQRSILPDEKLFASVFSEYFVHWEPRDVVGGDLYWCSIWGDGILVILGDCTGHGVPGAFMTLISTGALERAKEEVPIGDTSALIQRMHQLIQTLLGQHGERGVSDDGLELGVCFIDSDLENLSFAGARFSLFVAENGDIREIKSGKKGIGYRGIPMNQEYDETKTSLAEGQTFYMTSDGLIDQVGGEKRRSFGKRRFREMLLSLSDLPLTEQKDSILETFSRFQGEENRRDDLSFLGFKIY
ncbi:MAG: transporter substrate-binding domain-containing protein [Rhodospirillales bacterium]|nr:transporter substrate-binding domain-containing protein [Rhodospirillales bacterium]